MVNLALIRATNGKSVYSDRNSYLILFPGNTISMEIHFIYHEEHEAHEE